jgi:signal transduction histidine kinase
MNKIYLSKKKNVFFFASLIIFIGFISSLKFVAYHLSTYYQVNQYKKLVLEADRLSSLEKDISFDQALKIFNPKIPINVFDENCAPVFVSDLLILQDHCLVRNSSLNWLELEGSRNRKLIISFHDSWLNFKSFYEDVGPYLILISVVFLIFICFLILFFYYFFINAPVKKVSAMVDNLLKTKNIDNISLEVRPDEMLFNLYQCIMKLINEVIHFNKQTEKLKLSRQIAHDLRGPLSILDGDLETNLSLSKRSLLAISKIREIANELMPEEKNHLENWVDFDQLFFELKEFYKDREVDLVFPEKVPKIKISISQIDLFRSFNNLIKNSIEASARKIIIDFTFVDENLHILFRDDGIGMDPVNIPAVIKGATSKVNGNGLGLSSFFEKIQAVSGFFEIVTKPNEGFSIKIQIPFSEIFDDKKSFVLIDDDKFIRLSWKNQAKNSNVNLLTFESIDQFLEKTPAIPFDSSIFIDSCLKNGVKGEVEAERIYKIGFKEIFLSTGYNKSDFNLDELPWIKNVVSKAPPFA